MSSIFAIMTFFVYDCILDPVAPYSNGRIEQKRRGSRRIEMGCSGRHMTAHCTQYSGLENGHRIEKGPERSSGVEERHDDGDEVHPR